MFTDATDCGIPATELRRRAVRIAGGPRLVRRDPAARHPILRCWDLTIADVDAPGASGAAGRVRVWAHIIRRAL